MNRMCCLVIIVLIFGCSEKQIITFNAANADTCIGVNSDLPKGQATSFSIEIVKNTITDTIRVNSIPVVPNQVGRIFFQQDYYLDTARICIQKGKATNGIIKLTYNLSGP